MSNIDKQALRKELSNPAIGSNAHLRKLALATLDELEASDSFRTAFTEWHDKTNWVQDDKRFDVIKPWGKHRADVLKLYIDHLESKLEATEKRIAELEARDKPKFVQCWSCKHVIEVLAIADCDGYCPHCAAPIDLDDEPYAGTAKGE